MITERDIDQAIEECKAERDPDAWVAMRWAAFLTIKWLEFGHPDLARGINAARPVLLGASFAPAPASAEEQTIQYTSPNRTEFGAAIDGKRAAQIWPIMDELMSITQALHPEIYKRVMELVK